MKTLLIASFLFSLNSFATTFVVEMKAPLTKKQITHAQNLGMKVELFAHGDNSYLKRTYEIQATDSAAIKKHLPTVLVENVYAANYFSLEAGPNSVFTRPDQMFHLQWGLQNQGQRVSKLINNTKEVSISGKPGVDIRWAQAIKKIEAGMKKEPVVAVIDMGIDLNHPEIKSRLFKNPIECDAKGEIVLDGDEDKDNNGYKGDCIGWNFAGRNMYEARRPSDDTGHGTHVAGIIAAETNKEGISGVSSRIKILPLKVTGTIDETSDRKKIQPLTDRITKAIYYATNMGVDVINLSLGWTASMDTEYLRKAMVYAIDHNVVIVAAAGNNNNNASIFPCAYPEVICVGAATIDGSLAEFSNYGGEVDLLAPGDEIVSLVPSEIIPLQLNLQGYDIRSGTSQATPFVSAAAALLRGNFPRMHRLEITRRLVDSADPGVLGQSLSGMLNLQGAFEIAQLPSIKPTFKRFSTAPFSTTDNKFLYRMELKNMGVPAKGVVIKVTSKSPALKLDQEFLYEEFKTGYDYKVLKGDILDLDANNQISIQVSIAIPEVGIKVYQHQFRLSRDVGNDNNFTNVPFEFLAGNLPVGIYKDKVTKSLISTVETLSPETGIPEYYLPRQVKETNTFDLKFFRAQDGKVKEVAGMISIPGVTQLLNVTKLDMNFDGSADYLIRAVACDANCEDETKASRYIQYSVWNKDLSPLLGAKSVWKFLPIMFNVDMKSQRFVRVNTKEFGPLALPAFLETGIIPLEQQKISAFSKPDQTVARRVYYIDPVSNKEGKVELITRTLSTSALIESIRSKLKASVNAEVQAMHLLNQTKADLKIGRIHALVSIGKGYLRQNVKIALGADDLNISSYDITQNLWGYEFLSSTDLESQDLADSFTGLVSRSRLMMFQNAQGYSYSSEDSVEAPLGTIASFKDEANEYTFFQTPSYLVLAHNSAQGTKLSQLKINRFSFLPGTLFNDSFYPVLNKLDNKFSPALYVDETDIQSNLVSFTVLDDGELKSPIRQSARIPENCKAMNPIRLDDESGHSLTMLCFEKQWVMKFIQLNQ
jgi:cell wall-associated protease